MNETNGGGTAFGISIGLAFIGENSRNRILCTPSVNRPRERRMSMRPRSAG